MKRPFSLFTAACVGSSTASHTSGFQFPKFRAHHVLAHRASHDSFLDVRLEVDFKHYPILPEHSHGSHWESVIATRAETIYLIEVEIGGQKLLVLPDTGSTEFWVMTDAILGENKAHHHTYNHQLSPTAVLLDNSEWGVEYGTGEVVSGLVFNDSVRIADLESAHQGVEIPTYMSQTLAEKPFDGILGLGSPERSHCRDRCVPFFQNIMDQLSEQLFTFKLKHDIPGFLDFGSIDHSAYVGNLAYASAQTDRWIFATTGFSISGGDVLSNQSVGMLVDTGSEAIVVTDNVADDYWSQVDGHSHHKILGAVFPCSAHLPDFSVHFEDINGKGIEILIPGRAMVNTRDCNTFFHDRLKQMPGWNDSTIPDGKNYCLGQLRGGADMFNIGEPFGVLGGPFLREIFTVFDYGNKQIGFARQS